MVKKSSIFVMMMTLVMGIVGSAWGSVSLSAFDPAFCREYISGYDSGYGVYDSDGNRQWVGQDDGILSNEELKNIKELILRDKGLKALPRGIEYLTYLEYLDCCDNELTNIDVSRNIALKNLACSGNQLTRLDVSGLRALEGLVCSGNQLVELKFAGCPSLTKIDCVQNQLISIDVSGHASLYELCCNDNQLVEVNVRNCPALQNLFCENNQITELDLSTNPALTKLECNNNRLTQLDVSSCPALTYLYCSYNQLTELDVGSNHSLAWTECANQKSRGLKLLPTKKGYEVNLKEYVKNLDNVVSSSIKGDYRAPASYDPKTGIAVFKNSFIHLQYNYSTPNSSRPNAFMDVTLTKAFNLVALERSGFTESGLIIRDIKEDCYMRWDDQQVGEGAVLELNYADNGKLGIAADGNSRLIIRLQTDKPGKASFSLNDDIGAKLESLTRRELSPSDELEVSDVWNNHYNQVSAVLVAPEIFPDTKNFPSDTFSVHVKFTDEDGKVFEDDLELKIEAAPVLLIPGMFDSAAKTFGKYLDSGVWRALILSGFNEEHIYRWDYDDTQTPHNLLWEDENGLYKKFVEIFNDYAVEGIVCTRADVIAHGLGGLMARSYLQEARKDMWDTNNWSVRSYKQGMVRRLITVATPHDGTSWADVAGGQGFITSIYNGMLNSQFEEEHPGWDMILKPFMLINNTASTMLKRIKEEFTGTVTAWDELVTGSDWARDNDYGYPYDVPMYAIAGEVAYDGMVQDAWTLFTTVIDIETGANIDVLNPPSFILAFMDKSIFSPLYSRMKLMEYRYSLKGTKARHAGATHTGFLYYDKAFQFSKYAANLKLLGRLTGALSMIYDVPSYARLLADCIASILFKGLHHDLVVSTESAKGKITANKTYVNKGGELISDNNKYAHWSICQQLDVGMDIASLLKWRPVSDFTVFRKADTGTDASVKAAVASEVSASLEEIDENAEFELIRRLNLSVTPSVLGAGNSGTVKFTVTADEPVTEDVLCTFGNDETCRFFKMPASDSNRTKFEAEFEASGLFSGIGAGTIEVVCFSAVPGDAGSSSMYVSNTACIASLAELNDAKITRLEFTEASTLYVNVNSEVPVRLYAVADDGKYYDVSSPSAGTSWTASEFARVNENGCLYGLQEGSATLTASFRGFTASLDVEVGAEIEYDEPYVPPQISTAEIKSAATGQHYSLQLTASGTTPITWTHTGSLPDGLTLSESGLISGTPTKAGSSTFTVTATNSIGNDSRKFTLQVLDPVNITTSSLKTGTIGKPYSITLKAKGTKPLTWSAEGLPSGLKISEKGKISGKPTEFGTFTVKFTISNGAGNATKELKLNIKGIPPKISGSLAKAELSVPYSSGLKLSKGSLPITWSITGELPDGLVFDASTGVISGTPTSYKSSGFKLKITASNGAGEKSKSVKLKVKGTKPKITTTSLPNATQGRSYNAKLTATGSEPITWKAENLPEGLSLNGDVISGTPMAAAKSYKVKLTASNPVKSAKKTVTLKVIAASDTQLPVMSEAGKDSYSFAEYSVLPYELTLANSDGYVVVAVLPEISVDVSGMYDFDIALSDDVPVGAELLYLANSDEPSDDDEIAEFFGNTGEISVVPESRRFSLSIWFNEGVIYSPAIAVKK